MAGSNFISHQLVRNSAGNQLGYVKEIPFHLLHFDIYINDLSVDRKGCDTCINIGDLILHTLFYADNFTLISDSGNNFQKTLDAVFIWCKKSGGQDMHHIHHEYHMITYKNRVHTVRHDQNSRTFPGLSRAIKAIFQDISPYIPQQM